MNLSTLTELTTLRNHCQQVLGLQPALTIPLQPFATLELHRLLARVAIWPSDGQEPAIKVWGPPKLAAALRFRYSHGRLAVYGDYPRKLQPWKDKIRGTAVTDDQVIVDGHAMDLGRALTIIVRLPRASCDMITNGVVGALDLGADVGNLTIKTNRASIQGNRVASLSGQSTYGALRLTEVEALRCTLSTIHSQLEVGNVVGDAYISTNSAARAKASRVGGKLEGIACAGGQLIVHQVEGPSNVDASNGGFIRMTVHNTNVVASAASAGGVELRGTIAQLRAATTTGGSITVQDDITGTVRLEANTDSTIHLQGKTQGDANSTAHANSGGRVIVEHASHPIRTVKTTSGVVTINGYLT